MAAAYIITGEPAGYNLSSITEEYSPHTGYEDYHPSCVELEDGRALVMYSRGTSPGVVYQAYVSSIAALISGNDTITSETAVLENLYYPRASVFWGSDGYLYFAVTYTKTTSENVAKTLVYKSTSKDGSDWTLHGTVQSVSWDGNSSHMMSTSALLELGVPHISASLWILPCVYYQNQIGYLFNRPGIFTSSDNGETWINQYNYGTDYAESLSRNIGKINGEFWWCFYYPYLSNHRVYVKSPDGINWTNAFSYSINAKLPATIINDSGSLYLLDGAIPSLSRVVENAPILKVTTSPASQDDFADTGYVLPMWDRYTVVTDVCDTAVILRGIYGIAASSMSSNRGVQRIRGLKIT